jgi:hypothetical protein
MPVATVKALSTQEVTQGKNWDTNFLKITTAAAYTAGRWYDLSMGSGTPRLNVYPGGLAEATRLWYKSSGAIFSGTPVNAGETKHLSRMHVMATAATVANSMLMLCDYLMFYALVDADGAGVQDLTTEIALPRYPTGDGVQMLLVTTTDLGATPGVLVRARYTNSAGVADRLTPFVTLTASAIAAHIPYTGVAGGISCGPFMPLQDGDSGVRSVQKIELSTGTGAGYFCVVLVKPLATMSIRSIVHPTEKCMVLNNPTLPEIKDEAFLSFLVLAGGNIVASSSIYGSLRFIWGNT